MEANFSNRAADFGKVFRPIGSYAPSTEGVLLPARLNARAVIQQRWDILLMFCFGYYLTERDYTAPEVPIDAMRSDTLHAHDKGVTQDAHPIPR